MAVKRTVESKVKVAPKKEEKSEKPVKEAKVAVEKPIEETGEEKKAAPKNKKYCNFCVNKMEPHYWDVNTLRRHINDRGRIIQRGRLGTCSKHQRRVSREVKRARHLAILPFTSRI